MEGGLHASPEKMVIDADLLSMVGTFLQPLIVDDATRAVDAIAEVGPAGITSAPSTPRIGTAMRSTSR